MIYGCLPYVARLKISKYILKKKNAQYGEYISFVKKIPYINNDGHLKIGNHTVFDYFTSLSLIDVKQGGNLEIGESCYINEGVNIFSAINVSIGDHCLIGTGTYILDLNHQLTPSREAEKIPVIIGKNCWLGAKVIILPGTKIGDHSIIGAGSVVKGEIPERSIAVGSPAKVVSRFEADDNWIRK